MKGIHRARNFRAVQFSRHQQPGRRSGRAGHSWCSQSLEAPRPTDQLRVDAGLRDPNPRRCRDHDAGRLASDWHRWCRRHDSARVHRRTGLLHVLARVRLLLKLSFTRAELVLAACRESVLWYCEERELFCQPRWQ